MFHWTYRMVFSHFRLFSPKHHFSNCDYLPVSLTRPSPWNGCKNKLIPLSLGFLENNCNVRYGLKPILKTHFIQQVVMHLFIFSNILHQLHVNNRVVTTIMSKYFELTALLTCFCQVWQCDKSNLSFSHWSSGLFFTPRAEFVRPKGKMILPLALSPVFLFLTLQNAVLNDFIFIWQGLVLGWVPEHLKQNGQVKCRPDAKKETSMKNRFRFFSIIHLG